MSSKKPNARYIGPGQDKLEDIRDIENKVINKIFDIHSWPEFHKYTYEDALNDVIDIGYGKYLKNSNPIGNRIANRIINALAHKSNELDEEIGPDGPRGNYATDSEGNIIQQGNGFKNTNNNWIHHVKTFSKTNNISFKEALKNEMCKSSYKKSKG